MLSMEGVEFFQDEVAFLYGVIRRVSTTSWYPSSFSLLVFFCLTLLIKNSIDVLIDIDI